jgi:hypothetical protein
MFEFISNNYWDVFAASTVCYILMFACVNSSLNRGVSGLMVIFAAVVFSLLWPLSIPYVIIRNSVDFFILKTK